MKRTCLFLAALFASALAQAQSWPAKPIRIIVPFAPGATMESVVRALAPDLTKALGHPIIVENKPGAGTVVGVDAAAKSAPDGEIRRESYSNRFATALEGLDNDRPGIIRSRAGAEMPVPRVVAKLRRVQPVELRDMQFLRQNTDLPAKITLPGPFTMAQQAKNDFYANDEEIAMDFAAAVNAEALGVLDLGDKKIETAALS